MSSIIVCIDINKASENALKFGSYLAKKNNLNLHILAVIEGSHKNLLFGSEAISSQKLNQIKKHINKLIENICVVQNIIPNVTIKEGDVIAEITKQVNQIGDCKMIIFGKSQNKESDNIVLPKIVGKIGLKIQSPVIIIPENFTENDWMNIL
jgi:hypothetical protein